MKIKKEDVIDLFGNPIFETYTKIEYGKVLATANEYYIKFECGEEQLLHDELDKEELKSLNIDVSNNGPGFDLYHKKSNNRLQSKFRTVNGKTPFSVATHFENTRRHSEKNKNSGSKTGHTCYSDTEFDYVIVTLNHMTDDKYPHYTDWKFALIPISALKDPKNKGFCFPNIPSDVLKKYKCENIGEVRRKIKEL